MEDLCGICRQGKERKAIKMEDVARGGEDLTEGMVVCVGQGPYGQCGHESERSLHPTLRVTVMSQMRKSVVMVAAGLYHSVVVTDADEVYSCGRNLEMQLGHEGKGGPLMELVKKPFEGAVVAVDCGHYHTTLLSEQGEIAECGRGRKLTVLRGLEPKSGAAVTWSKIACGGTWTLAHSHALRTTWAWDEQQGGKIATGPEPGNVLKDAVCVLQDAPLLDLKAGKWEALFLTEDSRLLTMRFDPLRVVFRVEPLESVVSIVSLACGTCMNAAQTVDGSLVTWKRDGSTGACSAPVTFECDTYVNDVHCGGKTWACAAGTSLIVDGVPVLQSMGFAMVRCGYQHTLAVVGQPKGQDFVRDMVRLRHGEAGSAHDMTLRCADGEVTLHALFLRAHALDPEAVVGALGETPCAAADAWVTYLYCGRIVLTRELCTMLLPLVQSHGPPRLRALVERYQGSAVVAESEPPLYDRLMQHCLPWCDVTLISSDEGTRFPFPRCVLQARSSYFSSLFSDRWSSSNEVDVDTSAGALRVFLQWCGGCRMPAVDEENAVDVLQLANVFDGPPLVRAAERFLSYRIAEEDVDSATLRELESLAQLLDRKALLEVVRGKLSGGSGGGGGGGVKKAALVVQQPKPTPPVQATFACRLCTYQNASHVSVCDMCGASREAAWICEACTFENTNLSLDACEMCNTARNE